jgi:hypothetical protein
LVSSFFFVSVGVRKIVTFSPTYKRTKADKG